MQSFKTEKLHAVKLLSLTTQNNTCSSSRMSFQSFKAIQFRHKTKNLKILTLKRINKKNFLFIRNEWRSSQHYYNTSFSKALTFLIYVYVSYIEY